MNARPVHGSAAWFHMVGSVMCEAANRAALPQDMKVSFLERYTDAIELRPGLRQGLRLDIAGGKASCRIGAGAQESADIIVELSAAASYQLNSLYSADPRFQAALLTLRSSGALQVQGDLARLGDWFNAVHDIIVERTA